ncbi:unnamed protein product [Ilex paraguariensis]|uniref:CID domain-containing protein n=1 Tax=Ilex paraguariensis TaxID=185542 RepID=A0ABC8S282_9AQUA
MRIYFSSSTGAFLSYRAFCNPADVEAFTEEKKESLLTKRHGKGADFVRAVQDIVDSYEKLRKQEQVVTDNSSDEVTISNASAAAATRKDALLDAEMLSGDPTGNCLATNIPLSTSFAFSGKLKYVQPKKIVTRKRAPSARNSRSSARVEPSRFQNFLVPSSHGAGDKATNISRDGYVRMNKHIRKPSDGCEGHDSDSPAFVPNCSIEEDGSDIVTVDSDALSFNEGSTVESGYKQLQPEPVVECCEGDVELGQRLDLAGVVKKKRKANRKRVSNDTNELTASLDKEAGLEIKVQKTGQLLPSYQDQLSARYSKEDGDEHLPLVKRARVRRGRSSSAGEERDSLARREDKFSDASNSILGQGCTSLNSEEDTSVRKSTASEIYADSSSPSNKCPVNKAQPWELKKNQLFGCSVDGEAALPPTKRLHRALEAMSANAGEDGETSSAAPSIMKTYVNESSLSSLGYCTSKSMEGKTGYESGAQNVQFGSSASQEGTSEFSTNLNPSVAQGSTKSFEEVAACDKPISSNDSPRKDVCTDILVPVDCAEGKDLCVSSLGMHTAEIVVVQDPKALSPNLGEEEACLTCNQVSMIPNGNSKTQISELSKPCKNDPLEFSGINSQSDDTILLLHSAEGKSCGSSKLLEFPSDQNSVDNEMYEALKETKPTPKDSSTTQSPTRANVTMAAVQGPDLCHPITVTEDHLDDKAVSDIRSSSSLSDGLDSTARASPPNTSICKMSTSDNGNSLENNGCCSPEVHLQHEKPKQASKWSNRVEANAALTSFEVILGTLTRTKESIGRATRIAIDCAKFGSSAKRVKAVVLPSCWSFQGKSCGSSKLLEFPSDQNSVDNEMYEALKETKPTPKDSSTTQSPTRANVTMAAVQGPDLCHPITVTEDHLDDKAVTMAAVQGPDLSHPITVTEDHLDDKAVSDIRSSSSLSDGLDSTARASPPNTSICKMSTSDNGNSLENNGCCSPEVHLQHEKPKQASKWSNRVEANAALTSFEVILGTLTRTKESIGRATRIAIDCAKFGSSAKVVEILLHSLENESRLDRRVDLFFLVDSITQCSRGLKGDVGGIYPSAIQAVLARLLLAAAPPGSSTQENRRQCLKVLRVWQERRILPESIIRRYIRELDSLSSSSLGAFSRRPLRNERAFDDPIREMEGMLVDEYGSNSSFQLPGFRMPPMLKDEDEGSDSDVEGFEAVTPEHYSENIAERERTPIHAVEKHRHILEDVDGELEMEDVAPTCEAEMSSTNNVIGVNPAQAAHHQFKQHLPPPFAPPSTEGCATSLSSPANIPSSTSFHPSSIGGAGFHF